MTKEKAFYVTTPIYYVNDVPHIGHAYCTIVADVLARFERLSGRKVFFLTGTDEHGQKVERAAQKLNRSTQAHVDKMVVPFKNLWKKLDISYDDFIRTTEPRHEKVVQAIFQKLADQNDIYKSKYEGWYCVHEETFYTKSQLKEKNCPECGREVEWVEEESYYFKTSKYQDKLLKHIAKNPTFVQPEVRRNEVVSFIKQGVQDVCVSRTTFKWGVPVPFDEKHVVYVWFDALINYLTGAGYLIDENNFKQRWPAEVHLIGKDILKFHAVIWPSMLFALDVELPKQVFATGFWTLGKEKISKSKGIVVDPNQLADTYGADTLRYFLLREITLGLDGEFSQTALIKRINFDLANDLGNLLHRTLPMIQKYSSGKIPELGKQDGLDKNLAKAATSLANKLGLLMRELKFRDALAEIWQVVGQVNKYIDQKAPWKLSREEKNEELNTTLGSLAECIRIITILISPFMPSTAEKIWQQLGLKEKLANQTLADAEKWGTIPTGTQTKPASALFPRIEPKNCNRNSDIE